MNATATVVARSTRDAILALPATWTSHLLDSFADNHLNWPIGITQDHSLSVDSQIIDGQYQWTVHVVNGNSYFNLVPSNIATFTAFYAVVTVVFGQGNDDGMSPYGVAFRHVDNDYGFFGISKTGLYRILEVHNTGIYQEQISDSAAINKSPDAANRIAVIGVGSDFVFLVNDQPMGQINADITPGQIGLGVDTLSNSPPALVQFTNFEVDTPK